MPDDDVEVCGHPTKDGDGPPCQHPTTSDGDPDRCWVDAHNETETDSPPGGRPTKLDDATREAIAADVEQGRSMRSAARKQGITPQTVMNWLKEGESKLEAGVEDEYTEFFKRLTRAKGYGEEWYFETITELAAENDDHRFLASLMKQRYPDSWGETETGVEAAEIEVSSEVVEVTEADLQHE